MADAVGLAAELDEPPVVDDAVDQGGGHLVVPEHRPHLLNSRFVVNTTDCLSYASARTWKSSLAPSASSGRNPSSSMTSRRALPMIAASRSSLPSSRARLRRITSEDAVKKRASSLLSHASAQRPTHVRLAGADVAHSDGYPAGANPQSVLLEKTVGAYERLFGAEPRCVRSMPDWNAVS